VLVSTVAVDDALDVCEFGTAVDEEPVHAESATIASAAPMTLLETRFPTRTPSSTQTQRYDERTSHEHVRPERSRSLGCRRSRRYDSVQRSPPSPMMRDLGTT
jgi:hypothetical protein